MKFISLCSGIEAASVAFAPLGWKAAAFAEIEPFPCTLLKHHYPDVPNFGDMTAYKAWPDAVYEQSDLIVGGPPCQAFSLAGLRNSLDDARGNLTLTYVRLIDHADEIRAMRGQPPVVALYENVPGILSTKDNAFGSLLAGLAGESEALLPEPRPDAGKSSRCWTWNKASGSHSLTWPRSGCVMGSTRAIAWRVLDAQFFGLAQRRKRVFVVASARNGFDPACVLFEFEGVRRDTAPRRESRENVTHDLAPFLTSSGRGVERTGDTRGQDPVVAVAFGGNNQSGPIDVATARNACSSGSGRLDFESETFVVQAAPAIDIRNARIEPYGPTMSLQAGGMGDGRGLCINAIPHTMSPVCVTGDITHTLKAEGFDASEDGTGRGTLSTGGGKPGQGTPTVQVGMAVRRLTPMECERLQGFPDSYTQVPVRGKPAADGPRYKALGNSWAVPVVSWIGARVDAHLRDLDARA